MCNLLMAACVISLTGVKPQAAPAESHKPERNKPNIIFILADDLGYTDLGCYGSGYYKTPNIDRLAAEGIRFTDGYTCGPNCQPTRAALISGQYGPRTGVYTVGNIDRFNWRSRSLKPVDNVTQLPLDTITIAQALKSAGYATGMFGKWHLGNFGPYHPGERGFDEAIVSAGKHFEFKTSPEADYPAGTYLADFLTDRAEGFIRKHKDKPFFMYLPHFGVHSPYQAKNEWIDRFKGKAAIGGHHDPVYAAMISSVDESVGRILTLVDELGLAENTLVIFSSDNGGVGGYGREGLTHARDVTDNAPLRGGKGMLYEGGVRVPYVFRWPGRIPNGTSCDQPIISVDLYPTLLEIAGAERPSNHVLDGISYHNLLTSGGKARLNREAIYWHFPGYLGAGKGQWRTLPVGAIRTGDFKLMQFFEDDRLELYNLRDDPGEKSNLVDRMPDKVKDLQAKLVEWRKQVGAQVPRPHQETARKPRKSRKWNKQAKRPNIVLIMSDDMGYSDIGCYGGEIRTPTLDRLAAGGLRFSQFYNMARCCPTRAALLTGLHPHLAGVGHMTGAPKDRPEPWQGYLSDRTLTIGEVLRTAGYATYMCGKWHVGRMRDRGQPHTWPLQRGFDRFYGTITGAGSFYDPVTLTRGNQLITPDNDPEYRPDRFYYTDAISDNAVRFIADHAENRKKPFFLYVAYTAAHWPMHAPEESIAKYRGKYDQGYQPIRQARLERLRKLGLVQADWAVSPQFGKWADVENKAWEARCMEVYAAMIDRMDEGIGRITAELEKHGLTEDTLILFLQDNGGCAEPMGRKDNPKWHLEDLEPFRPDDLQTKIWPPMQTRDGRPVLGGPGVMPGGPDTYIAYGEAWANVSNTPFREYKHWVHEGGIATPLIAYWPGGIPRRGEIEHQPGQVIDIMATCVELAGGRYPARHKGKDIRPLEGTSLVPALEGGTILRDAIYWEHEGNRAIRIGKWKLVAKGPAGDWELYDMERDRTELHDLAARHPEHVADMATKWEAWAHRAGVLPWIWKPPYGQVGRRESKN